MSKEEIARQIAARDQIHSGLVCVLTSVEPCWSYEIVARFPFSIQICLNGRAWLARQMEQAQLQYVRQDNCFTWIQDYPRAQSLMDQQLQVNWPQLLAELGQHLNPIHPEIFVHYPVNYYWNTYQSEWAMDLVFRPAEPLRRLYPKLVQLGMTSFERRSNALLEQEDDPKREIREGRWSGAACGAVLPACTVARRSPSKRWTVIGMP